MAEYKYVGRKAQGESSTKLVIEGSAANPIREVVAGGTIELSDEEVKELRDSGYVFRASSGSSDDDEPDSAKQQQPAQPASGAQHGTAEQEQGDVNPKRR